MFSTHREHSGVSLYWNDDSLLIEPYQRKKKQYFCGNQLIKTESKRKVKYIIVIVDLTETYCATIYEDCSIEKMFEMSSGVPSKHKAGGQSAQRFSRIREQKIVEYFKRINRKLTDVKSNFIIAINFMYKTRLQKYLSTENKNKVIKFTSTEYGGLTGCYQARNINIKRKQE